MACSSSGYRSRLNIPEDLRVSRGSVSSKLLQHRERHRDAAIQKGPAEPRLPRPERRGRAPRRRARRRRRRAPPSGRAGPRVERNQPGMRYLTRIHGGRPRGPGGRAARRGGGSPPAPEEAGAATRRARGRRPWRHGGAADPGPRRRRASPGSGRRAGPASARSDRGRARQARHEARVEEPPARERHLGAASSDSGQGGGAVAWSTSPMARSRPRGSRRLRRAPGHAADRDGGPAAPPAAAHRASASTTAVEAPARLDVPGRRREPRRERARADARGAPGARRGSGSSAVASAMAGSHGREQPLDGVVRVDRHEGRPVDHARRRRGRRDVGIGLLFEQLEPRIGDLARARLELVRPSMRSAARPRPAPDRRAAPRSPDRWPSPAPAGAGPAPPRRRPIAASASARQLAQRGAAPRCGLSTPRRARAGARRRTRAPARRRARAAGEQVHAHPEPRVRLGERRPPRESPARP